MSAIKLFQRTSRLLIQFSKPAFCSIKCGAPLTRHLSQLSCSKGLIFSYPKYYSSQSTDFKEVDQLTYEKLCEETLESLTEYFEEIVEADSQLKDADISYSTGVLTVNLGKHGTYVINRQSPNKQIWLSSPVSGPKRYDLIDGYWVYRHNGESLHQLLQNELSKVVETPVDFSLCNHAKL